MTFGMSIGKSAHARQVDVGDLMSRDGERRPTSRAERAPPCWHDPNEG